MDTSQPRRVLPTVMAFGFRALEGVEGGIETHVRELYPRLAHFGFRVTALTRHRYREFNSDSRRSRNIQGVSTKWIWAPHGKGVETFVHSFSCTAYCLWCRPALVHIHGIGPGVFAILLRIFGIPVLVTHHGHDYDASKWGPIGRSLLVLGEKMAARWANRVICVSHAIRRNLAARTATPCTTIYNGVTLAPDTRSCPTEEKLRNLRPSSYVLVVGRLTSHKRVLDVIAAMDDEALTGRKLVICGSLATNDPAVSLLQSAARRNPRVILAGFTAPPSLPWLYHNAVCTVMASSYEGLPFVALEALAAEGQVLLSDIDAHLELGLPPGNYFRTGNVDDLKRNLAQIVKTNAEPLLSKQDLQARFDWDHIAEKTARVFLETIHTHGTMPPVEHDLDKMFEGGI